MTEEEKKAIRDKTAIPVYFCGRRVGFGHFRDTEFVATIADVQINNLVMEERLDSFSLDIRVVNKEWDNGLATGYGQPSLY